VITDGEHTVAESGAIIEYILEKYGGGRLVPNDEAGRLRYRVEKSGKDYSGYN
jgi:glutathione S-transferase